jgi:hypothetical protein
MTLAATERPDSISTPPDVHVVLKSPCSGVGFCDQRRRERNRVARDFALRRESSTSWQCAASRI